jgi:hypothetical protein
MAASTVLPTSAAHERDTAAQRASSGMSNSPSQFSFTSTGTHIPRGLAICAATVMSRRGEGFAVPGATEPEFASARDKRIAQLVKQTNFPLSEAWNSTALPVDVPSALRFQALDGEVGRPFTRSGLVKNILEFHL